MENRLTKYRPLIAFLGSRTENDLVLTLTEIEALIGLPLPTTAYVNPEYWHGQRLPHVRRWRALGWQAQLDRHDRHNLRVHFTRDTRRE